MNTEQNNGIENKNGNVVDEGNKEMSSPTVSRQLLFTQQCSVREIIKPRSSYFVFFMTVRFSVVLVDCLIHHCVEFHFVVFLFDNRQLTDWLG